MSLLAKNIADSLATTEALHALEPELLRAAELVRTSLLAGGKLLVCGNGGSAADGADFSTEYSCRFMGDRPPFPALNLAQGGSLVTAIGNDYGYEDVFSRQIWAFGKPGDVLVAITTSGNSKNIERALVEAKVRGLHSIALLGKSGGICKDLADVELLVRTDVTARIQEAHKFLLHTLCELVEPALKG
jgi:D-sedoheptulose 7-phosphate isomerase